MPLLFRLISLVLGFLLVVGFLRGLGLRKCPARWRGEANAQAKKKADTGSRQSARTWEIQHDFRPALFQSRNIHLILSGNQLALYYV
jgi:hypothetical protein